MSALQGVDPTIISAVTAGTGAVLIKLIERWISKRATNLQKDETTYRIELKEDLNDTKEQLEKAESDVQVWMKKYYDSYEKERTLEVKLFQTQLFLEEHCKICKSCKTNYKKFIEETNDATPN